MKTKDKPLKLCICPTCGKIHYTEREKEQEDFLFKQKECPKCSPAKVQMTVTRTVIWA